MQVERSEETKPELVGVQVINYKNLRDVWLPWSDGLALFGVNGAGKTNLLECLALLLGTPQTLALAAARLAHPAPGAMAVLLKMPPSALPYPPDEAFWWEERVDEDLVGLLPFLGRPVADASWWRLLGATHGRDFAQALTGNLPAPVAEWLAGAAAASVVRYDLEEIEWSGTADSRTMPQVRRCFGRTLMADAVPAHVAKVADQLPDVFAPLRAHLGADTPLQSGWVPVLELPKAQSAPATLQWIAGARTAEEVSADLERAFAEASEPAEQLAELLEELGTRRVPEDQGWHWWLHEWAAALGRDELLLTLPGVTLDASGQWDADFEVRNSGTPFGLGRHTGKADLLEYFSAGERRWIDEALATTARELNRFAERAALYADCFRDLQDEALEAAIAGIVDNVARAVDHDGYWAGETYEQLLRCLEPYLLTAARARLVSEGLVMTAWNMHHNPGLRLLMPQLVVRVFDEPEAHLHPAAQRRTAVALQRLRLRGQNVLIASHSAHFLDLPDWTQVHVERLGLETKLVPVPPSTQAQGDLARQLGVNRGELLAGIDALLLVEGQHDQVMLERMFGADLRAAGIAVVRMHGTNNLLATAELDFLDRYLDVPVIVLLDYTSVDRVKAGLAETHEERQLGRLLKECDRRGRPTLCVGLNLPDIVCYLPDTAVRQVSPDFPGWDVVVARFREHDDRPSFKKWVKSTFRTDLTTTARIERIVDVMERQHLPPVAELSQSVRTIISHTPTMWQSSTST